MFKFITLSVLLTVILFGSIGIGVFKHICEEDGTMVSYVFDNAGDHCDGHEVELPPCCEDQDKDDCCSDEVEYKLIKLDFFESLKLSAVIAPLIFEQPPFIITADEVENTYLRVHYINPPPPDSREIRLQKEMWII
jgi:hypothetical protein